METKYEHSSNCFMSFGRKTLGRHNTWSTQQLLHHLANSESVVKSFNKVCQQNMNIDKIASCLLVEKHLGETTFGRSRNCYFIWPTVDWPTMCRQSVCRPSGFRPTDAAPLLKLEPHLLSPCFQPQTRDS